VVNLTDKSAGYPPLTWPQILGSSRMLDSHKTSADRPRLRGRGVLGLTLLAALAFAALPASASAVHNSHLEVAEHLNAPGTPLTTSFNTSDTTLGDPFYNPGEPTQCNAAGTQNFGSSVYYKFHPHRNGRVRVSAQATSGDLEPVVAVLPYSAPGDSADDLGGGVCNGSTPPINRATLPAEGWLQAPDFPISAGQGYVIMIGGATVNNLPPFEAGGTDPATEGGYSLSFVYDPDSDGDGLFDGDDRCDGEPGEGRFAGCGDADGDQISTPDDRCPSANAGAAGTRYGGCPDNDRDGVAEDGTDRCPTQNPARFNRNDKRPRDGCPDILNNPSDPKYHLSGLPNGAKITDFVVDKVPSGARVVVKCKLPNGRKCGGLTVKRAQVAAAQAAAARGDVLAHAARKLKVRKLYGKSLPFGTTITVRVTARFATGAFYRIRIVNTSSRVKEQKFCMRPGSKRLRKGGCA
jgi:hypothetical protein